MIFQIIDRKHRLLAEVKGTRAFGRVLGAYPMAAYVLMISESRPGVPCELLMI